MQETKCEHSRDEDDEDEMEVECEECDDFK
jgi:hypothetical protein